MQLMELLKDIDLPIGEWCVFGGACLAVHGIRPTEDVDIFVTPELYEKLRQNGWQEYVTNSTNSYYLQKVYDGITVQAFITCGTPKWRPSVKQYIGNPEIIEGMPFMPLEKMYAWKTATRRPKDIEDLKIMKPYLNRPTADTYVVKYPN